jgi:predicted phosphoadenosine phosphosulfate sulfurtransferase
MPAMTALEINVYDAALKRVRIVYDLSDDVIVSMSGGKDSTVLLHLALVVAAERDKLPVKVYWLDQEAEWAATVDYMKTVMHRADVEPYWFQFPFRLTNSMSHEDSYLCCWDPAARESWIRDEDPISIKENPLAPNDRFHFLVKNLPSVCCTKDKERVGVLVGVRMAESMARRFLIWSGPSWQGIIETKLGNHSFRATGITAYLKNGGTLEKAAAMANHASTRTTQLYDRRRDEVSLDEVERIVI